jgi:effector-binding domain-containing protein
VTSGDIKPKYYEEIEAVTATHYGEYNYFNESYETISRYIEENSLKVTGEAFEVYLKTMMDSNNPMDWETIIAFPLMK